MVGGTSTIPGFLRRDKIPSIARYAMECTPGNISGVNWRVLLALMLIGIPTRLCVCSPGGTPIVRMRHLPHPRI